jgi:tetratricopeptide (TPR) repeat protein
MQKKDYAMVYLSLAVIILTLFSIRSFVRSLDYKDNLTLYGHDVRSPESAKNYTLMNAYATELSKAGRTDEAMMYVKKSIEVFPSSRNVNNLGRLYQEKGQYDKALEAYSQSITLFEAENYDPKYYKLETAMPPYLNKSRILSTLYPEEGVDFIKDQALKRFPNDPELYIDLAHAYVKLRNKNEALKAAEQARKLAPENQEAATLYEQISNINPKL